jgi:hypothetical protein
MDKAIRGQLLRARLRALGRFYPVPKLATRIQRREIRPSHFRNFIHVCVGQHVREMPKDWISKPDKAQDLPAVKPRRIARKSPLTAIAEKWGTPEWFKK